MKCFRCVAGLRRMGSLEWRSMGRGSQSVDPVPVVASPAPVADRVSQSVDSIPLVTLPRLVPDTVAVDVVRVDSIPLVTLPRLVPDTVAVDVVRMGGESVLAWEGSGKTSLAELSECVANAIGAPATMVRLTYQQKLLTGATDPIGELVPAACTLGLILDNSPPVFVCLTCDWHIAGFTCASCEELLGLGTGDNLRCPTCHGGLQAPICCKKPMQGIVGIPDLNIEAAKRRDAVDRRLCPTWSCKSCSFGTIGVRCMQCAPEGREVEKNGHFERCWCTYVWTCPRGCARKQKGGLLSRGTLKCRCNGEALDCQEYIETFGEPRN